MIIIEVTLQLNRCHVHSPTVVIRAKL